jgi:prepilin-type N-terminal cleavage/methylation domain-containing protein
MRQKNKQGFTLLELLIVIAIISVLAVTLIPSLVNARRSAANTASIVYGRNVMGWVSSWLWADNGRRVTDLSDSCVDAMYVSEGAPPEIPVPAIACEVLIEPNGPNTFGVRITSASGIIYENFY